MFALLNLACAATQSQSVVSNVLPQNSQEKSAPTPPSIGDMLTPIREPTKLPIAIGIPTPINDADYIISKLTRNKMKKATLNRQPQEIIESVLEYELSLSDNRRSPDKVKISVEERDLNQDGVPERILASRLYTDEEVPSLRIFRFENEKWNCCIFMTEGSPDNELSEIEFLSKPNKSDFDLIKLIDVYGDREVIKNIFYYQMQNGKYELVECHKLEGKIEKVVACGS